MPLTVDNKATKADENDPVVNETLSILSAVLAVGPEWTHEATLEAAARLRILQSINGGFIILPKDHPSGECYRKITDEEVMRMEGMRCNVVKEPRARWLKLKVGGSMDDHIWKLRRKEQEDKNND